MHVYKCVGFNGHECNERVIHQNAVREPRCANCIKGKHRVDCRMYNAKQRAAHRAAKAEYKRKEYAAKYSKTGKKEQREATRSSFSHSLLMHAPTEKAEKYFNKILSGGAIMADLQ